MEKLTRKQAFELAVDAYYGRSSVQKFSAVERVDGFKAYLDDLNKDFRANQREIFQIIEDTVNAILPVKVRDAVKQFAEFKNFDDNTTVKFKVKNGKIKAVNVAIGGSVRRTRVDKGWFTVKTDAVQCKAFEEYERVIGGQVDWAELINDVIDAIQEAIMVKVYKCLTGIYASLPTANAHTANTMEQVEFDRIINTIKAYGVPVIMGTPSAIATVPYTTASMSEADRLDLRNKGYVGVYKGCAVVELAQSFEDESNTTKVFDDQYLFVIPSGQEKIVKVALEGGLKTRENYNTPDWTYNIDAYQKVGTSVYAVNNIGVYKNTSL